MSYITEQALHRFQVSLEQKQDLTHRLHQLKEFDLLRMFVENPKHLFERENILLNLWGEDFIGESRTLDMHISKLRKKLGIYSNMIKSIRGLGYRMEK